MMGRAMALALCLLASPAWAQLVTITPSGGKVTLVPISTQTASAAASMQWTGLGTSYNDYLLECYGVFPATNGDNEYIQFGEGAGPTWKTSSYLWSGSYVAASAATVNGLNNASDSGIDFSTGGAPNTSTQTSDFTAFIRNIPSSTIDTSASMLGTLFTTTSYAWNYSGHYNGDQTAKTAIRVIAKTTNISGTCSLWGIAAP